MSIEKFKTFEAARRALWCFEPDAEYYRKVADHFNLGRKLCPKNCPKGIFRYLSVSDWDAQDACKAVKQGTSIIK